MDALTDNDLLTMALRACCEIIFSSSSDESEDDSDDDYEYAALLIATNSSSTIPRLQSYVEAIVPRFNDGQFKAHFR